MTLTPFADLVYLNTDRIADPAAAGIERSRVIGPVETAFQHKKVLQTTLPSPQGFHALRQGYHPAEIYPMTLTPFADLVHLNTNRIADPAAAGIERSRVIGAVETASQHKQVLRTATIPSPQGFHALRQGFIPPEPAKKYP